MKKNLFSRWQQRFWHRTPGCATCRFPCGTIRCWRPQPSGTQSGKHSGTTNFLGLHHRNKFLFGEKGPISFFLNKHINKGLESCHANIKLFNYGG